MLILKSVFPVLERAELLEPRGIGIGHFDARGNVAQVNLIL